MKDLNTKHFKWEVKTHVTDNTNGEMIPSLNKDLYTTKVNDKADNENLLFYSNPGVTKNNETILLDSLDTATDINKDTNTLNNDVQISAMPDTKED